MLFLRWFIKRCIYDELLVVATLQRYSNGELQEVQQLHSLQAARQQEICSALRVLSLLSAYSDLLVMAIYIQKSPSHSTQEIKAALMLKRPIEKTEHAKSRAWSCQKCEEMGKMIEKGLVITGNDAELLSAVLAEVKTKAYDESEVQLDDTQALETLVSCFRTAENDGHEKETHHPYFSPLRKRLVIGTIIDRQGGADGRKA